MSTEKTAGNKTAFRFQTTDNVPKYEQLKRYLIDYIAGLPPDQEFLPYEKELMAQFQVCRGTVRQAMARLRRGGYIETARKRGSRILRRMPGDEPHRLLEKVTGRVGFILANNEEESSRSGDIRWQLVDEFERKLIAINRQLSVYNLRENDWHTWHDPETLCALLREKEISWVAIRPESDPNFPLKKLLRKLEEEQLKVTLLFQDPTDLTGYAGLLRQGVDYLVVNSHPTILGVLKAHFTRADLVAYINNEEERFWADSRSNICKEFAGEHGIPFLRLESRRLHLMDIDRRRKRDNIDQETVRRFLAESEKCRNAVCFLSNDYSAASFLRQTARLGADPQNITVIGHDNQPEYRALNLNTIDFNAPAQAEALLELLREHLDSPIRSLRRTRSTVVNTRFIDRRPS